MLEIMSQILFAIDFNRMWGPWAPMGWAIFLGKTMGGRG